MIFIIRGKKLEISSADFQGMKNVTKLDCNIIWEIHIVRAPCKGAHEYRAPPVYFNRLDEVLCCFLNENQSKKVA